MKAKRGPGRPKGALSEKPAKAKVTVTLEPDIIEWLRKLGGGNVSAGIRVLARRSM